MSNPLSGFQDGLGWLQAGPQMLSMSSALDPNSGVGLFFLNYGSFFVVAVGVSVFVLGALMWHGKRMVGDEI